MNKKIIGLLSLIAVFGIILTPVLVSAQGISITPEAPPAYGADDVLGILPRIINYAFGFLIAVVVLMIIIAAYMFITAGGSSDRITSARKFLMFALIGLAVGVLAQGLVALVRLIVGTPGGGIIM